MKRTRNDNNNDDIKYSVWLVIVLAFLMSMLITVSMIIGYLSTH